MPPKRRRVIDSDPSDANARRSAKRARALSCSEQLEKPQLSFGFEIEALFIYHDDLYDRIVADTTRNKSPFRIIHDLLDGSKIDITQRSQRTGPDPPFSKWRLKDDRSVRGFGPQLGNALEVQHGQSVNLKDSDNASLWQEEVVEFCSPKYTDMTTASEQLDDLFSNATTDESFLATNSSCGLHVHIGRDDGQCMSLKALQCLAFITIAFEKEIDKLHPRDRNFNIHCQSNRLAKPFYQPNERRRTIKATLVRSADFHQYIKLRLLHEIRDLIFDTESLTELQDLMGKDRERRVNFTHIDDKALLKTVEFRQHAGSVNADEIRHWTTFCMAMVRWAYKLARMDEPLPEITKWTSHGIQIVALLDALELPDDTFRFYRSKVVKTRSARYIVSGK